MKGTYGLEDMSDALEEDIEQLIKAIWGQWVDGSWTEATPRIVTIWQYPMINYSMNALWMVELQEITRDVYTNLWNAEKAERIVQLSYLLGIPLTGTSFDSKTGKVKNHQLGRDALADGVCDHKPFWWKGGIGKDFEIDGHKILEDAIKTNNP